MAVLVQRNIDSLLSKCHDNALGCQLYSGERGQLDPNENAYAFKRLYYEEKDDSTFKYKNFKIRVHRHMYLLHNDLHPTDLNKTQFISHRCHHKRCVAIDHLNLESLAINNKRKMCVSKKKCIGHVGHPNCIFLT